MELFKKITHSKKIIYYFFLLGFFLLFNSLKALGSQNKLHSRKDQIDYNFEEVYFQNSIPYDEYDSVNSQLNSFFGLKSDLSTKSYPDLNIVNDSKALREIYRLKLNDIIINESINKSKK